MTFMLMLLSFALFAAPIPLSNQPVLDSAAVAPNIMFFIDTSGSMNTNGKLAAAQNAAIEVLQSLQNQSVRVGLSRFDGNGARIIVGMNEIANNYSTMVNRINNLNASGGTPLANTLLELGRYFVQGYNTTLTLHPDQLNQTQKPAYTVFYNQPSYAGGVSQNSPIQYYCQKSFILLLTDGIPNSPEQLNASSGLQDYYPLGVNICPYNIQTDTQGSSPCYVDDIAAALFDIDLRPGLTAPTGVAKKNNVSTYPIGFAAANPDQKNAMDTLLNSVATAGGGVYLYAEDADTLVNQFNAAAAAILSHVSTASAVAFNSLSLTQGSAVYIAQYNTTRWSGNVIKRNLNTNGLLGSIVWEAASLLDNTPYSQRTLFTYNRDTKRGIPFNQLSSLSADQQADLTLGADATVGQARLDYVRGNRVGEGTDFRVRDSVLGDIINSGPLYVGPAISNWPDTAPFPTGNQKYSLFKAAQVNRTPVVYAGANDGMLHAFNANTGRELFGYIPESLFSTVNNEGLHYLSDPAYQHRFYVDLPVTVADAYVSVSPGGAPNWHTILIGGERNGGNGYFALDITNPSNFVQSNANNLLLWEFSSKDDDRLGRTYSQPVIGLMNNGRWAAIFGNGFNAPGTNTAHLFVVYLDGGLNGEWREGRDYFVFDTKEGNSAKPNGIATISAVDLDGNGTIDRVYAGDLDGKLWAFNVASSNPTNWKIAYGGANNPRPLFSGPPSQSVTVKPVVVKNPRVGDLPSNQPNVIVMFGTGQLLSGGDKNVTTTQTFYGIWDHGNDNIGQSRLVEQLVTTSGTTRRLTDFPVPYLAPNSGQRREGWYINFRNGERIVTNPATRAGLVFFSTTIPNMSSPCDYGGTGFLMTAKVENGGQPPVRTFYVYNYNELNNDDMIDDNDFISGIQYESGVPSEFSFLGDMLYVPMSSGSIATYKVIESTVETGRISWRQIERN